MLDKPATCLRARVLVPALVVLLWAVNAARLAAQTIVLQPNLPEQRELSGAQTHCYEINLAAGHYLRATVAQRGIDVVVEWRGKHDELLARFDDEISAEEKVEVVADTGGAHKLLVRAKLSSAPPGSYEIGTVETHVAAHDERRLYEARKLATRFDELHRAGRYDEARPFIERAVATAEQVLGPEHVDVARLVAKLGNSYHAKKDFAPARDSFAQALTVLEKELGPEHPRTAYVANRLGVTCLSMNEIAKADQLLRRALEASEKALGPEHPQVALCAMSLAQLLCSRADTALGEQLYRRALAIAEKDPAASDILLSAVLNNLGLMYINQRRYEQAAPFLQRALNVEEKMLGPDHLDLANILQNLGVVAREKKDYATAERYYLRALAIRERSLGADHQDVAANLNNIANLYRAQGAYAKSLEVHLRALAITEKTAGPYQWLTILSLGNIAKTYAAAGNLAQAVKFQARADAAIETAIALNLAIGSERQKLTFLGLMAERTDRTVSLHMQLAPDDAQAGALAMLVLLQRKGRALDAMTDTFATLRRRSAPQDQVLLDQLNDTTARLARAVLNDARQTSAVQRQQAVKELEEQKEKLEAEISRQSAAFSAQAQTVSVAAVQAAVPEQAALVEFTAYRPFDPRAESNSEAYGEPRYAVYVMRRQGVVRGKDLGEARAVDAAVNALREALRDPRRGDVRELARAVDEKVMRPVREIAGDAAQLLVAPDGALNLIPFEALVDEQGRYLIERHAFSYLTSGRDLLRLQIERQSQSAPLIIANPLFGEPRLTKPAEVSALAAKRQALVAGPNSANIYFASLGATAQEAQSIGKLFAEATVLTGARATEAVLKHAAAPRLLHIATHGFFLRDEPKAPVAGQRGISARAKIDNPLLRTGLALAGANTLHGGDGGGDDGILTALEASNANLWGTKLVALSACDTGLGEVKTGEGVYGLRRAFVLAGAETLVMSLWPVSDYVTRELMTGYYRNLKQGAGRGAALRQVQLSMLRRPARQHPFYWAGFIQAGEWANLDGAR